MADSGESELETELRRVMSEFNDRVAKSHQLRDHLEGKERLVRLDLGGGLLYNFRLEGKELKDLQKGDASGPQIVTILSDTRTMTALLKRELTPIKAYATGKLKIKADLGDLLTLKKIFEK